VSADRSPVREQLLILVRGFLAIDEADREGVVSAVSALAAVRKARHLRPWIELRSHP
jgi:hypothetical protein